MSYKMIRMSYKMMTLSKDVYFLINFFNQRFMMALQLYCQCLYIKTFEDKGFQSSHCKHPPSNRWNLSELAFILLLWNHVKSFSGAIFFLLLGFLHRHWRFTGQQGKGGDHLLFLSTTSTRSRTLRHLFATLHVRWLSCIFNRNAYVYQTANQWDLPPYRITIWVIAWWCNVCLFTWWIDIRFLLKRFDIGNRWIWTVYSRWICIVYRPYITSESTNQVC